MSSNGTIMLAGEENEDQLYISSNKGVTWTQRGLSQITWAACSVSADGMFMAATGVSGSSRTVVTSSNAGITWVSRSNRIGSDVSYGVGGGRLLFGAERGGGTVSSSVARSDDNGLTWTYFSALPNLAWATVRASADGTIVAASTVGASPADYIWISRDGGATWTSSSSAGLSSTTGRAWGLAMSSDGQRIVAINGRSAGTVYTSSDAGQTWTLLSLNVPYSRGVVSSYDGQRVVIVQGLVLPTGTGYIFTSTDFGATWVERRNVLDWNFVASSGDGTVLLAGGNSALFTSG
jgi:hypothetical protein